MKRFLLWGTGLLMLLVIAVTAYVQFTLFAAGGGLPAWDGEVQLAGVESEVTISRDEHGIPHISASTEADLYFAQGFVHAQDRFWQMALARQATLGRLSEWFGSSTLRNDRIQRMWGWQQSAEASYASLSADDKRLIDAYVSGINSWLASEYYRRPPEMRILHVQPEAWSPTDPFVVGASLFQVLAAFGTELNHGRLQVGGVAQDAADMLDPNLLAAPPIIGFSASDATTQQTMSIKENAYSDNWTLAGEHTASGLPLMANDPQLPIGLPNTWQMQAHNLNGRLLAGGTLPGIPGILVGHNGSIAWGITAALVDVTDLAYLEEHPEDSTKYRRGSSSDWETYSERTEQIKVRFGSDLSDTVRSTSKGVVWPAGVAASILGDREHTGVELRTVVMDEPGQSSIAFVRLNRAGTVEEGIEALRGLTALALNFSLADVDGNIGYVTSGRVAIRDGAHATTIGFYPDDDNEWVLAPFDENPRTVNPPGGRIVTANQKIIGDEYPYYLSDFWAAPFRAWRIHEVLDETETHDITSFRRMQVDTMSPVARKLVPLMLQAEALDAADEALVSMLEDWDYRFTLDSEAATIWATWAALLRDELLGDELNGLEPPDYAGFFAPLQKALGGEKAEWCDDTGTEPVEDCAHVLTTSLTATRLLLEERFGADPAGWKWGEVVRFRLVHQGFGNLPVLGARFSRETPMQGGPESLFINAMLPEEAPTFKTSYFSSSYQGIYDLSSLEDSLFMMSGGSSGHFKSPHYNDMTPLWTAGERIKLRRNLDSPSFVLRIRPVGAGQGDKDD